MTDEVKEVHDVDNEIDEHEDLVTQQFLTFIMAGEEYGVDILSVQEIRGWESSTLIPNSPDYLKGVINLRGTIVPIVDLRIRFGLPKVDYNKTTVVIVLRVQGKNKRERVVGIVVDAVSDVYSFSEKELREAPEVGNRINSSFIKGLADVNQKMVILLQLESLLELDDLDVSKEA